MQDKNLPQPLRRQKIIEHARTIAREHGEDAVTIRAVAARANVTRSLIHKYFGKRADLIRTIRASENIRAAE